LKKATHQNPQRRTNNGFNASSLWANSICIGFNAYRNTNHPKRYIACGVCVASGEFHYINLHINNKCNASNNWIDCINNSVKRIK
jgi:hypothetical protein